MTIQGAIAELQNLLEVDDVPFYYKGGIKKVIETIQMEMADRKTEPSYEALHDMYEQGRFDAIVEYEDEPQTEVDWKQRLCDMYGADRKSFDEAWQKYEADKVEDEPQTDCAWGKL